MKLSVRPVDFAADREQLLSVLQRNLQDVPHEARLSWLYLDNPAGPARSWFLCEEDDNVVGVTSLFPRAVWLDGNAAVCGQVGDFGVDLRCRSLGPAIMLQRATFEPVLRGALAFCYDCPPHERGMTMFHRLGLRENCRMHAYVKPLRTDRQLERWLGQTAGRITACAANPILRLASRSAKPSRGLEFGLQTAAFGPEFSALDKAVQLPGAIRNRRSAEDLNWRFGQNPLHRFQVLTARRDGELLAYLVLSVIDEDAFIFDMFGRELSDIGPALLQSLTELLQGLPVQTLRALVAGDGSYPAILRQVGFSFRGAAVRVVAFAGAEGPVLDTLQHKAGWQFLHSDIMA
jgi:hypothetical protein